MTTLKTSKQLGIQSREPFESNIKIPLGFSTLVEGELEYQISIENVEGVNLSSATVYLIDHLMDTVTILNDNPYTFTSKEGTYHQRFTVLFERGITLGPDDNELQGIILFPNPTSGIINITGLNEPAEVKIYSIQGQLLKSEQQVDSIIDL